MYNELLPSSTFNTETSRSGGLIPGQLRTDAAELIKFLEEYYRLSNSTGNPSNLVNDFLREHDIDSVTDPFFTGIQNLIAKTIPNSNVFDRQTLYKRIIDFYSLRGSEVSVKAFFKIFYNEISSVSYPKDDLLKPSSGNFFSERLNYNGWLAARKMYTAAEMLPPTDWNNPNITDFQTSELYQSPVNWTASRIEYGGNGYIDTNGFTSESRLKLQDSYFWQDYSYVVYNAITSDVWSNNFLRLVHPAGLKYFHVIRLEVYILNFWDEEFIYEKDQRYWVKLPPNKSPDFFYRPTKSGTDYSEYRGYHSPINQPGVVDYYKLPLDIVSTQDTNVPVLEQFSLEVNIISDSEISISKSNSDYYTMNQLNINSADYMNQLKFIDTSAIAGFDSHVILPLTVDTTHSYSPINGEPYSYRFPPTAVGTYIRSLTVIPAPTVQITTFPIIGMLIRYDTIFDYTAADANNVTTLTGYYNLAFRFRNCSTHTDLVSMLASSSATDSSELYTTYTARENTKFKAVFSNNSSFEAAIQTSIEIVSNYNTEMPGTDACNVDNAINTDTNHYYLNVTFKEPGTQTGDAADGNRTHFIWDSLRWYGKDDLGNAYGTTYNEEGVIIPGTINSTGSISHNVSLSNTPLVVTPNPAISSITIVTSP